MLLDAEFNVMEDIVVDDNGFIKWRKGEQPSEEEEEDDEDESDESSSEEEEEGPEKIEKETTKEDIKPDEEDIMKDDLSLNVVKDWYLGL